MASKFQNRLIGTVIIVALGVIVLPGLLDGQKKHYQDEFAAIPLVPKPGEVDERDVIPSVAQPLSDTPQPQPQTPLNQENPQSNVTPPPAQEVTVTQPQPSQKAVEAPKVTEPKPKPENKPKTNEAKPVKPAVNQEKAPTGQAYVVQLGALKNASRVNEIIAKLRLSGYRAYTLPPTPVQGEVTRIFVGPDTSKQKLEASLSELNNISGLNGQVRNYSVR